jgi:hypothetical protein
LRAWAYSKDVTIATQKQTLAVAFIVSIVSTGLVASDKSLPAWVMAILIAFGPSIVALHSWMELAQTSSRRLQDTRGVAAAAVSVSRWNRRRGARNLGWMSAQWLAERRAADHDGS